MAAFSVPPSALIRPDPHEPRVGSRRSGFSSCDCEFRQLQLLLCGNGRYSLAVLRAELGWIGYRRLRRPVFLFFVGAAVWLGRGERRRRWRGAEIGDFGASHFRLLE